MMDSGRGSDGTIKSDRTETNLARIQAGPDSIDFMGAGLARMMVFFLLVFALASGLDHAIARVLRNASTGEFGAWNRIVTGDINADIIVSGSSRALTHYDPRILEEASQGVVYNIGLNGSQTDMQFARLRAYLRHNKPPKLLIHNLDAFSFQISHREVYDPGQYMPYLDEPDIYQALVNINPDTWKWRYIPLYGYATQDLRLGWLQGIMRWLFGESPETRVDGYEPRFAEWTGEFDDFRMKNPRGVYVEIESDAVREFDAMLGLCSQLGIKVILVYSPEYEQSQLMTRNRREIFEQFEVLSKKYNVTFLDFSNSRISSQKDFFYNSQHLNARGASAFSRELASALKQIGEFGSSGLAHNR